jgi:SAM-dependent methyltransferase
MRDFVVSVRFAGPISGGFFLTVSENDRMPRCPVCGGLERHRLLWLFLARKTDILTKPPSSALHVAPELGLERKLRKLLGKGYVTADLVLKPAVDVQMDVTDIQYPAGVFEFVYCSHVLEHVPDDRKAMREFARVLSAEGLAIILVPIGDDPKGGEARVTFEDPSVVDPAERLRLFGQSDHVRIYGLDYEDRLRESFGTVERIRPRDFLSEKETRRMGVTDAAGDIYCCRK